MVKTSLRILLVDDEPAALRMLEKALSWHGADHGWEIVPCDDPEEAMQRVRHESFDVLVTDLHMPSMSGLELLTKVQELMPDIRGILMTAAPGVDGFLRHLKIAQAEVLVKPCSLTELIGAIHRSMGQSIPELKPRRVPCQQPLMQSIHTAYGLRVDRRSDLVEYIPIDQERLGLLLVKSDVVSVSNQLLRLVVRERAEKLFREGCAPHLVFKALHRLFKEQYASEEVSLFVGLFNRKRRTFSHAQCGFQAPSLERQDESIDLHEGTVNLHLRDVVYLPCSEPEPEPDELEEVLRITVAWGKSAQMEFAFAEES
jgi:CheY-like chemotaxis protein